MITGHNITGILHTHRYTFSPPPPPKEKEKKEKKKRTDKRKEKQAEIAEVAFWCPIYLGVQERSEGQRFSFPPPGKNKH